MIDIQHEHLKLNKNLFDKKCLGLPSLQGEVSEIWSKAFSMECLSHASYSIARFAIPWCTAHMYLSDREPIWAIHINLSVCPIVQCVGMPHRTMYWYIDTYHIDNRSVYQYRQIRQTMFYRMSMSRYHIGQVGKNSGWQLGYLNFRLELFEMTWLQQKIWHSYTLMKSNCLLLPLAETGLWEFAWVSGYLLQYGSFFCILL